MAVLLAAAVLLVGCSRHKTISRDELRSALTSSISLASEAETFIEYVTNGKATRHYAEGHIGYLAEEVGESEQELQGGSPEPGTESAVQQCRTELNSLHRELAGLPGVLGNRNALGAARERIKTIRDSFERLISSL